MPTDPASGGTGDQPDLTTGASKPADGPRRGLLPWFRRLGKPIPIVVAVIAGLVAVATGVAELIPDGPPPDPFGTPLHSESFTFPDREPAEVAERFRHWLPDEEDAVWQAEVDSDEGVYRLTNRVDADAVQYQWINMVREDFADKPVSVDVRVGGDTSSASAAGLIYRFNAESRRYYAFAVSRGGEFSFLVRRAEGGLDFLLTERSERIREGWNTLGVVSKGDQLDLHINGSLVRTVAVPELSGGIPGVVGISTGVFEFDNFQVFS